MSTEANGIQAGGAASLSFTNCPYWGKGGRYVVDLATNQRVPVDDGQTDVVAAVSTVQGDTAPADIAAVPVDAAVTGADTYPAAAVNETVNSVKEKKRG